MQACNFSKGTRVTMLKTRAEYSMTAAQPAESFCCANTARWCTTLCQHTRLYHAASCSRQWCGKGTTLPAASMLAYSVYCVPHVLLLQTQHSAVTTVVEYNG